MELVYQWLSVLSTALLLPVVLALAASAAWAFWSLGVAVTEALLRFRRRGSYEAFVRSMTNGGLNPVSGWAAGNLAPRLASDWIQYCEGDETRAEEALDRVELVAVGRIERYRFLARVAPALGLMGTLIPLGPALVALADGDLARLAQNLVVAFGTTVLGLTVSVLAQLLSLTYSRWYRADLADLERIVEQLSRRAEAEVRW